MADFIEVTNFHSNERVLINTDWIEMVCENPATIYFSHNCPNAIDQDYIKTIESYDEIKKLIWR